DYVGWKAVALERNRRFELGLNGNGACLHASLYKHRRNNLTMPLPQRICFRRRERVRSRVEGAHQLVQAQASTGAAAARA
ncbi:hypothetical protein QZN04_35080, partial [Burkholderia gladioli]